MINKIKDIYICSEIKIEALFWKREYLGDFFQEANKQATTKTPVLSSVVQIRAKDEALGVKNNLAEPEYDFLSKQPTEVIDETYRVSKTYNIKKIISLISSKWIK